MPGWALSHPVGGGGLPDGTYIYGTNYGGATVAVVDTATGPGGTSGVNLCDTRTGSACLEPG